MPYFYLVNVHLFEILIGTGEPTSTTHFFIRVRYFSLALATMFALSYFLFLVGYPLRNLISAFGYLGGLFLVLAIFIGIPGILVVLAYDFTLRIIYNEPISMISVALFISCYVYGGTVVLTAIAGIYNTVDLKEAVSQKFSMETQPSKLESDNEIKPMI